MNEDARTSGDRPCDLDLLLKFDAQVADLGAWVDGNAELIQDRSSVGACLAPVNDTAAARQMPHQDVLGDRQRRSECEFLRDRNDPVLKRPPGRTDGDWLAFDRDRPRV